MKKKNHNVTQNGPAKVLDKKTPFAVSEAFNQLRTNLMYATPADIDCPIYAITSVKESSGKSTIITNLSISFSQIGLRVLLVDGDMRCPSVYDFFGLEKRQAGLSELISGIDSNVIIKNVRPNLDVITSGRIPPNPSELLSSPKLRELIAKWRKSYDVIFFDFPPMGVVSDSVILSDEITGYLFAVMSGRDHAKNVLATIEAMEQVGAKILGTVLNDYDLKASGYYSYRYKYNYKYRSKYASAYAKQAADLQNSQNEDAAK